MNEKLVEIFEIFEVNDMPQPLFYNFEFALRFELGGEKFNNIKRPIARFSQALNRAKLVADTLFGASEKIQILYASYNSGEKIPSKKRLTPFKMTDYSQSEFELLGQTSLIEEDDDGSPDIVEYRFWEICDLKDKIDLVEFLWLSITKEMPVKPNGLRGSVYVIDQLQKTMLHIYDDRGMDVVAMDKDMLKPIYNEYKDWLLDCDIDRMKATFGK